jgi:hypothetical protein
MSIPVRQLGVLALLIAVAGAAAAALVDGGDASSPDASSAATPQELSTQLAENDAALRRAIDSWGAGGDPPTAPPPDEVMFRARYLQGTVRFLANHPSVATATIALLPASLAGEIRHFTIAARKLRKLAGGSRRRKVKTGPPPPLAELIGHYDEAQRRYGIGSHFLAAIHLVETKFGRVKSKSVAGARGPMQFIPSTWRIYGRGGNIHDPHDAILAAARLLRSNGAPRRYARALHAYNPSRLYVNAVSRYARVIAADPFAVYFLFCWGP